MDEKMEAFRAGLHQLFAEFPDSQLDANMRASVKARRRELLSTIANWERFGRYYIGGWSVWVAVPKDRLVTLDALIFG